MYSELNSSEVALVAQDWDSQAQRIPLSAMISPFTVPAGTAGGSVRNSPVWVHVWPMGMAILSPLMVNATSLKAAASIP